MLEKSSRRPGRGEKSGGRERGGEGKWQGQGWEGDQEGGKRTVRE